MPAVAGRCARVANPTAMALIPCLRDDGPESAATLGYMLSVLASVA